MMKKFTNFCFAPTQWRALMMSILFLGGASFSAFAATYYSDPTSAAVVFTTNATGGTVTSSGWSTDSTGTTIPFGTVTIMTVDNIVIQAGSTVTTAAASGQTIANITFNGGTLLLAASSFNCQGNITGTGVYSNATGNVSRIDMISNGKTLNASLSGTGGFSIGSSAVLTGTINLGGNTSVGGRIAVGKSATATNALSLNGYNLSADNIVVNTASKIIASGVETINITGVTSTATNVTTNTSQIYFDQTTPGTTNTLANLTINNVGAVKLLNEAKVSTVTLTKGNVVLGASNLTVGTIVGGSSTSFISTDNKLITGANGSVICSVAAGVRAVLPMGTFTASYTGSIGNSYDPVALTPTSATIFTVHVRNMFLDSAKLYNVSKVTKREWNISSSSPSATVLELTPMYPSGTSTPVIGHYNSNSGVWEQLQATRSVNTWTATTTSFSPFGVGTDSGFATTTILPISLKQFTVTKKKAAVLLNWATENETNNASFLVQQSANGSSFKTIGQVKGNGNTSAKSAYSFEDKNPALGLNYYRLKQLDVDGRSTSSAVQLIRFSKATLSLKATVVTNALDITVDDKATAVSVFSMGGQKVLSASVKGTQQINVSSLQAGRYVLQTAEGESVNFIKQ